MKKSILTRWALAQRSDDATSDYSEWFREQAARQVKRPLPF
jgi:hypothetical protein